jgi:allantoicase
MNAPDVALAFTGLVDLAARTLGGHAVACSDDFFASMDNLVAPGRGIFVPGEYTDRGKWMDGWESRRRRGGPESDYCIVALGAPGHIRALDIDTNHFLGNHPPYAALDVLAAPPGASSDELMKASWTELLPQSALKPGAQNLFAVASAGAVSHVRLRIFPDGGVARLRVYGHVEPAWDVVEDDLHTIAALDRGEVDLASLRNGGMALACSDMFFSPMQNLIMPRRATDMGGGWETRRKRAAGHDWIVLKLGARGRPTLAVFDTAFFRGNYPDRASIDAIDAPDARITDLVHADTPWRELVPETKLSADARELVRESVRDVGPVSHVRVNIYPDGGLSRLRLYGTREG